MTILTKKKLSLYEKSFHGKNENTIDRKNFYLIKIIPIFIKQSSNMKPTKTRQSPRNITQLNRNADTDQWTMQMT